MAIATIFFDLGETLITTSAAGISTRFADTLDALQVLSERGWRIGLLSNQAGGTTLTQVQVRLASLGLARWIDPALVTVSTELPGNVGKPQRPIFDLALSKAGLTATPAAAVFVTEEAAHVTAARGFGWRAVVIKRGGVCAVGDGECATSLADLLPLLPPLVAIAGTNLDLAPPPKLVDGLWAVPIDISRIDAQLSFNAAAQNATGTALLQLRLGRNAGCPIFDLRQTPTAVELDGAAVPVADVALHDFGGGTGAELRVLNRVLDAGSAHTLRVTYSVGLPQASMAGSYLPQVTWSAGPRLTFSFGFTDLGPGRYLESFVPANLVFDQFEMTIELRITGTTIAHQPITNGTVSVLGSNHWSIAFPRRFTAFSPLLELRAADTLTSATHNEVLPISGTAIAVTAFKLNTSAVDVAATAATIGDHLAANETSSGRYLHGNRFTAFVNVGGMEYDGGTTSGTGALRHEGFHSWWGRGLKPVAQIHGWLDEAWTTYHDNGAAGVLPLNFTEAPVTLCSRNPWQRVTPSASYSSGERLWKGLAAAVGAPTLRARMNDFYDDRNPRPVDTEALEAHLLASTGRTEVVDAFHRFVYGLPDPQPMPDLWLRDDGGDTGAEPFAGRFWDSPDLWVRNQDDGGLTHQNPESGQDNWLYARVRNRSATATARHLVVSFNAKFFAGSQFVYPADWLPATTAAVAFEVGPGESRILKARWPSARVPPPGTHPCLLAAVYTRFDAPQAGKHVWDQNNLAQKNLTIVNLKRDTWFLLPFVAAHLKPKIAQAVALELVRPAHLATMKATLVAPKALISPAQKLVATPVADAAAAEGAVRDEAARPVLECGCGRHAVVAQPALAQVGARAHAEAGADAAAAEDADTVTLSEAFPGGVELPFAAGERSVLRLKLKPLEPTRLGLHFLLPADAKVGSRFIVDVVQRVGKTIVGGVAVEVRVEA